MRRVNRREALALLGAAGAQVSRRGEQDASARLRQGRGAAAPPIAFPKGAVIGRC